MRIAMLGHKRIPSRGSSVEIAVSQLSERIAALGHSVTVYNRGRNQTEKAGFDSAVREHNGVRIKNVPAIGRNTAAAIVSAFLAAVRASFGGYDIVHIHTEGACSMCVIPKLFGKRVIATIHGLERQYEKRNGFALKYLKFGENCAVRYADEIIVLSRNMQNYFMDEYGRDTVYIPNGAEPVKKISAHEITHRWGLKHDDYILCLGGTVPERDIRRLINAFRGVNTRKKLVIADDSSVSTEFTDKIKSGAASDKRVILADSVSGQLLHELYRNAYVYALPGSTEGMPVTLLEAMSFGGCCIVPDIPECAEVIGNRGITFKRSNTESLRGMLQMLCDDPITVNRCRRGAAEYICGRFRWEDTVRKTLELYAGTEQEFYL